MTDIQITVPVADDPPDDYCPREFMLTGLDDTEFRVLHRIRRALQEGGATLENGRAVSDSRDTVCWLLQQVDAA